MWFFKKKATPYVIKDKVKEINSMLKIVMYNGFRAADNYEVSIFELSNDTSNYVADLKANLLKQWKVLRHPSVVPYLDTYEDNNTTYVVTEKVLPFVESELSDNEKQWAIRSLTEFIAFMSSNANAIYGNLYDSSLFMTPGHEIRIGGLEWVSNMNYGPLFNFKSQWREYSKMNHNLDEFPLYATDVLMLSEYIKNWSESLARPIVQVGKNWTKISKDLPEPSVLLNLDIWNADKFSQMLTFLKELPLKDNLQREVFFKDLIDYADIFSSQMQCETIIPELLKALSFSPTPSILQPIFVLSKSMETADFTAKVIPKVIELFSIKNPSLRAELLNQMPRIVPEVDQSIANDVIFKEIFPGMNDPTIRQQTIIAMVPLASKLNQDNLAALMRQLDRLQECNDPQARTNSVICLAKIADHIDKPRFLATAFAKSARDGFAPARKAAVAAMKSMLQKFDSDLVCQILIPSLGPLLCDADLEVRIPALKLMEVILNGLMAPVKDKIMESEQPQLHQKPAPVKEKPSAKLQMFEKGGWNDPDKSLPGANPSKAKPKTVIKKPKPQVEVDDDENGWDDLEDDNGVENVKTPPKPQPQPQKVITKPVSKPAPKAEPIDDDDEGWGDLDDDAIIPPQKPQQIGKKEKPKPKVLSKPAAKPKPTPKVVNSNEDDGWDDIDKDEEWKDAKPVKQNPPKPAAKPVARKPEIVKDDNDDEDGWDDMDNTPVPEKKKPEQPKVVTKPKPQPKVLSKKAEEDEGDDWGNLYDQNTKKPIKAVKRASKQAEKPQIQVDDDDEEWPDWDEDEKPAKAAPKPAAKPAPKQSTKPQIAKVSKDEDLEDDDIWN